MSSNDQQRIRQIKFHINQLLSELKAMESSVEIPPLNLTIRSQLTDLSVEENSCPYLLTKRKSARLHSTAHHQTTSRRKFLFAPSARATSTPKVSPSSFKRPSPLQTSTPRRTQRHSTPLTFSPNQLIPLKRLLYNREQEQRVSIGTTKRRHSAVPSSSKRKSLLPRLQCIEEDLSPQWI